VVIFSSLPRIAIGTVPFLPPLMFQFCFGLNDFHTGRQVLRAFGSRRVLLVNGLLNAASFPTCAPISPAIALPVVVAVLFFGGLAQSMPFRACSAIAFADMPIARLAAGDTLFSTVFQRAMGLGVALGALGVRLGHVARARLMPVVLPAGDFRLAFGRWPRSLHGLFCP
jgi:hypothetical protein